jgi:peptidylprolyl isomerase
MIIGTRNGPIGRIIIELFEDDVPKTSKNFIELIKRPLNRGYKGCKLHRIIPGFVIQGGDITNDNGMKEDSIYGKYFEDENFKYKHDRPGLLSMANIGVGENGLGTNGTQFFITLDIQPHLDNKHVVFGQVIKGMDVVREIEKYGNENGTPNSEIRIVECGIL